MLDGGLNERFCSFHLLFKGLQNKYSCQTHLHRCFRPPGLLGFGVQCKTNSWPEENLNYLWTYNTMLLIIANEALSLSGHLISKWTLALPFLPHLSLWKQHFAAPTVASVHDAPCCLCLNRTLLWLESRPGVTAATDVGWSTLLSICSAG